MAWTAGVTGSGQTVAVATEVQFFLPSSVLLNCTKLKVLNASEGAVAEIRIPELHGATGSASVALGASEEFEFSGNGISAAFVTGENAVITWFPTAGG